MARVKATISCLFSCCKALSGYSVTWRGGGGVGVGGGGGRGACFLPRRLLTLSEIVQKKVSSGKSPFEKGKVARDFSPVQGKVPPCYTSCFLYVVGAFWFTAIFLFTFPLSFTLYLIFINKSPWYTVSNPYNSELPVTMLLCLYPSTFTCSPTVPGPLLPPWEVTYLSACVFLSHSLWCSFRSVFTVSFSQSWLFLSFGFGCALLAVFVVPFSQSFMYLSRTLCLF
jgi:hypothetical protein